MGILLNGILSYAVFLISSFNCVIIIKFVGIAWNKFTLWKRGAVAGYKVSSYVCFLEVADNLFLWNIDK